MNFFEAIKATLLMYKASAASATTVLLKNWALSVGVLGAFLVFWVTSLIFGSMGFAGGMLVGLVQVALVSIGYSWLRDSVGREKIKIKDLYSFDYSLFSAVINTGFVLFLGKFLLAIVAESSGANWIMILVQFALVIVLNALPEVLYLSRYQGMDAVSEAFDFIKRNWIEWFIPLVLILIPRLLVSLESLLFTISQMDELLPATIVFNVSVGLIAPFTDILGRFGIFISYLIGLILLIWFMLFRGFLYKELLTGSRRQRIFKSKLN